jgi:hypothetical protein
MWYVLLVVALHAFGAVTGWADLAQHLGAECSAQALSDADCARYRGTGESAEDLQLLTRA